MEDYRDRLYKRYRGQLAEELKANSATAEERAPVFRAQFASLLPEAKDAAIVDVGCGAGEFLHFLKGEGYTRLSGVDRSPEMVRLAADNGVKADAGFAEDFLNARKEQFDCVFALDVLEHMRKDELFPLVDAVYASLRPGGVFILQTVNAESPGYGRIRHADLTHETSFTRYSLSQLLGAAGFTDCRCQPSEAPGRGLRGLFRRILWREITFALNLYHHAESGSGLFRNDHIYTTEILASGRKAG